VRIAIPTAEGKLAMHFGHCREFALVDVDAESRKVLEVRVVPAPLHQPGLLPPWLAEQGVTAVIAGGMGMRARQLFESHGIDVIVGAPAEEPRQIALAFLDGSLQTGPNICDH
jgi:predicted Fe-Mo cluster-binding NifX family protein